MSSIQQEACLYISHERYLYLCVPQDKIPEYRKMCESVIRTRSLGVSAEGLRDQYADGKAARVWEAYIGCRQSRTDQYRQWIVDLLKTNGCRTVLDAACGTGVDSMLLVEEGFNVVSTDASDKMLKYALKERWNRRKEPAFDNWIIEEGNWMTLVKDVKRMIGRLPTRDDSSTSDQPRFDAVICLGNSFAHLQDDECRMASQRCAISNFLQLVRPGGILVIDHRNYDEIIRTGAVPAKNVYYNSTHIQHIKCSTLVVDGSATMVTMDYYMDASLSQESGLDLSDDHASHEAHHFRLSYYPHRLDEFTQMLRELSGPNAVHQVYADFKPLGEVDVPAYYIHVVKKPL